MAKRFLWIGGTLVALVIAAGVIWLRPHAITTSDRFVRLVTRGNGFLEKGDTARAIATYTEALQLSPESTDVRLNLANAYLRAGQDADVVKICQETLALDHNSGAAYYLMGCALLHQNQAEAAVQALQQSWKIDRSVAALDFQLGLAQASLGQVNDAIRDFEDVIAMVPDHPSAHYQLSRLYRQVGRDEDAAREMQLHQRILAGNPPPATGALALERCKYTEPLAPFVLAQPARNGVAVRFVDATATAFGASAGEYHGPITVVDYDHDGRASLFARESGQGFRLFDNKGGHFAPLGRPLASGDAEYRTALTGDLDDDGFDDVVVLGETDSRVFKFYAKGRVRDATRATGLEDLRARDGLLADLDFTGNLDILTVPPDGSGMRVQRNLGNLSFEAGAAASGLPPQLAGIQRIDTEDWNSDGLPGVFLSRAGQPPSFYGKKRAGPFAESPVTNGWPVGSVLAIGDLDNDLQPDAVLLAGGDLVIIPGRGEARSTVSLGGRPVAGLHLVDYDNDGWLDLIAFGDQGAWAWRNRGHAGFDEVTSALGLDRVGGGTALVGADFDADGDTDFVASSADGLHFWRNDGGNANRQLKLHLVGKRSNASALGVRVDVIAGNWRTSRTVRRVPLEIGVGDHGQLDAIKLHWFDLSTSLVDVPVKPEPLAVDEPTLPSGSCPYLYAWDGKQFRFVTDILGAAPLGLPASKTHLIPADPEEFLSLDDESQFPPRDGAYEVRVTDELREVLYLDEARLVVVDHPAGTLVYPTSKMRAQPPFPPHELWTLRPLGVPRQATRNDGLDVTAALARVDGEMASPVRLRRPQLRGLAEPFSVTLDFGSIPVDRPLVLALTGWLHFGGGMANIAASLDPTLPFPFPTLEVETSDGSWQKLAIDVGTPAGKTKTILVDLENKLPPGARRLRLGTAFEIHWDCARLCERVTNDPAQERWLDADRADMHWRGFSRYADLPASLPLTPQYTEVFMTPPWDRTPSGWCTRYGEIGNLVQARDDKLALLNGGDEVALSYAAAALPPKAPGMVRNFFLHVVGWDKDADFHVVRGWDVEPLPFAGMDDQAYGRQLRPATLDDTWQKKYNTRWVGPVVVRPDQHVASAESHDRDEATPVSHATAVAFLPCSGFGNRPRRRRELFGGLGWHEIDIRKQPRRTLDVR